MGNSATERSRRWREANPERARAQRAAYYERVRGTPERRAASAAASRRYRTAHLDAVRVNDRVRRRAPRAAAIRREWARARWQQVYDRIVAIKLERGCLDCGYRAHPAALEFDHRDPAMKEFRISAFGSRSWDRIEAEIAKCDVRCANCHRIRSLNEKHVGGKRAAA